MADARLELAEAFLQEAVYRSRARQALSGALDARATPGSGGCGLGEKAAVALDLAQRGAELFDKIWGASADERELERIRDAMSEWVKRQDALDRKRNHFLKDFRQRHGFDRTSYTPEQQSAYDAGLADVNAECDREKRAAAKRLLDPARAAS